MALERDRGPGGPGRRGAERGAGRGSGLPGRLHQKVPRALLRRPAKPSGVRIPTSSKATSSNAKATQAAQAAMAAFTGSAENIAKTRGPPGQEGRADRPPGAPAGEDPLHRGQQPGDRRRPGPAAHRRRDPADREAFRLRLQDRRQVGLRQRPRRHARHLLRPRRAAQGLGILERGRHASSKTAWPSWSGCATARCRAWATATSSSTRSPTTA